MQNILLLIRDRYHPLFHLRKFVVFQRLTRWLDTPVRVRFKEVSHPVYVSLSKNNLSWVISGGEAAEEKERENFVTLAKCGKFQSFLRRGCECRALRIHLSNCSRRQNGAVTMIEPDEDNVNLIRQTIARWGLTNVTVLQAASSDSSGTLTFYKDDLSGATGSVERTSEDAFVSVHHRYKPTAVCVKSVTLDELCTENYPDS